jgi:hypothetical protein
MMTQNITQTDLSLSSLLKYFQVTPPIKKVNTVNALIEEVLKRNKAQLGEKRAHLFKRLEENLPEIIVPDEPLKYILNFVLQYVILSTPPDGNIALLTTSSVFQREIGGAQALFERYGGYVEILVVFPGERGPVGLPGAAWAQIPTPQRGEVLEIMLRLVKGMVLKNWGKMDFESDKNKGKTVISLRFPLERRKVFFCDPHPIHPSATHPQS